MDEQRAREILGTTIRENDTLRGIEDFVSWHIAGSTVTLDGEFTPDELEAIAWWMRNKSPKSPIRRPQ